MSRPPRADSLESMQKFTKKPPLAIHQTRGGKEGIAHEKF